MQIFDIYSKRQKQLRGEVPEVYVYDSMPDQLKVQIMFILNESLGSGINRDINGQRDIYGSILEVLCREYGTFNLLEKKRSSSKDTVLNFFIETKNVEYAIDVIELCFRGIDKIVPTLPMYIHEQMGITVQPTEARNELNQRFKQHGFGYQYENGEMFRVDSTYVHSEIVKPTLSLLWNKKFAGANEEYLNAHEHYREGRNKECLSECLKAFESTLKIICTENQWQFNDTDTSKKLIQVCFQNNLVPTFTQNQFTSLQNLLESGVPTIRNRQGGHGQGQIPQKVDDEMTRYALNLTGTNIIFLVEQSGIK